MDSELLFVKLPWVSEIFRPRISREKELVSSSSRRPLDFVLIEVVDSFLVRLLEDKSKLSDKWLRVLNCEGSTGCERADVTASRTGNGVKLQTCKQLI